MRSKKCRNCIHHEWSEPDDNGNQDLFCKIDGRKIKHEKWNEYTKCSDFKSEPFYCASCGTAITKELRKAENPLTYRNGKNKGEEKKCCANPDWRVCPGPDDEYGCEGEAIICRNCGYYYGLETW
jgi:hypothetical protein